MWTRFTESARRAVYFAQEEAGNTGSSVVNEFHLLAGVLRVENSVGRQLLVSSGCDLEAIRADLSRRMPEATGGPPQDIQLSDDAKKVIDHAYDQSRLLQDNYIGTDHLILGMIAGELVTLPSLAVSPDKLRQTLSTLRANANSTRPTHFALQPEAVTPDAAKRFIVECTKALSQAQLAQAQTEGIPLADLPPELQQAAGNVFFLLSTNPQTLVDYSGSLLHLREVVVEQEAGGSTYRNWFREASVTVRATVRIPGRMPHPPEDS